MLINIEQILLIYNLQRKYFDHHCRSSLMHYNASIIHFDMVLLERFWFNAF